MNEFLILFILKINKANIYEIKKFVDVNFAPFLQISTGSIIPTLNKLEKNEYIKSERFITDGGLRKTIYNILPKGEEYFNSLLKDFADVAPQILRREIEVMFMILNHEIFTGEQKALLIEKIKRAIEINIKDINKAIKNNSLNIEFLRIELNNMEAKKRILNELQ